jgi:sn-glycerol 3-phosphate transport system ATP-binding protein
MTMADRLVVMNEGRAEQIGTAIEVYEHPATTFVATFIGSPSMNLMQAKLDADGARLTLGDGVVIPLDQPRTDVAGQAVTAGIRPEDLLLVEEPTGLELKLEMVEQLGADTLLHGNLAGAGKDLVTVRVGGHFTEGPEKLNLKLRHSDKLHLFDVETGARI